MITIGSEYYNCGEIELRAEILASSILAKPHFCRAALIIEDMGMGKGGRILMT